MKKHILALSLLLAFPAASVLGDQHLPPSPDPEPGPYTITNNAAKTLFVGYGYVQKGGDVKHTPARIEPSDSLTFKFDDPRQPLGGIDVRIVNVFPIQGPQSLGTTYYIGLIKGDKATILCEDNKDFKNVECYVDNK